MTTETQWEEKAEATSAEWLGDVATTAQLELLGSPDGDIKSTWRIDNAQLQREVIENPSVAVSIAWKDAQEIVDGKLAPSVAYMQGRLKPSGDMNAVLLLLKLSTTPEFRSWLAAVRP